MQNVVLILTHVCLCIKLVLCPLGRQLLVPSWVDPEFLKRGAAHHPSDHGEMAGAPGSAANTRVLGREQAYGRGGGELTYHCPCAVLG